MASFEAIFVSRSFASLRMTRYLNDIANFGLFFQPVGKGKTFSDKKIAVWRSARTVRRWRTVRTFPDREVFSATHMSRQKTDLPFFASADANSNEVFDNLKK